MKNWNQNQLTSFPDWWWEKVSTEGNGQRIRWATKFIPDCIEFNKILISAEGGWDNPLIKRLWKCQACDPLVSLLNSLKKQFPRVLENEFGEDIFIHLKSEEHQQNLILYRLGN